MSTGPKGQTDSQSATVSEAKSQAGNTHIAGEMFVAAELAKRGYNVSLTMGNAKAVDIFAERNGFAICIQVKALSRSKNVGWPLPVNKAKIVANVIYVCVILNEINTSPSYYILRPEDVLRHGKWYDTRAILEISKLKAHGFLDQWSIIGEEITKQAERCPTVLPTAEPESSN